MKDISELSKIVEKEIEKLSYPKNPEFLYAPIQYIMGLPGKRIRPILVLMAHQLFKKDLNKALSPAIAIEIFHNFTLLHDDIMDNAPLRRGNPTVHKKWNSNVAILSGDVMMIQSYQLLAEEKSHILKELIDLFSSAAIVVCEGQQLDMSFETTENVNLVDYLKMIEYKTAKLIATSLEIGAITAGANKQEQYHLREFGLNIGMAFQLKDDMLDVFGKPKEFGKQLGGDILANKKTFLYLKAIELSDQKTRNKLKSYYKKNITSQIKVDTVTDIFRDLNIEKYTLDKMKLYYLNAINHLDSIASKSKEPLYFFAQKLMDRVV